MDQFLDPETDANRQFLDPETDKNFQFLDKNLLDPETDVMEQFLDPETDIMGERTYIGVPPIPPILGNPAWWGTPHPFLTKIGPNSFIKK